jgi:hypothetical protein
MSHYCSLLIRRYIHSMYLCIYVDIGIWSLTPISCSTLYICIFQYRVRPTNYSCLLSPAYLAGYFYCVQFSSFFFLPVLFRAWRMSNKRFHVYLGWGPVSPHPHQARVIVSSRNITNTFRFSAVICYCAVVSPMRSVLRDEVRWDSNPHIPALVQYQYFGWKLCLGWDWERRKEIHLLYLLPGEVLREKK